MYQNYVCKWVKSFLSNRSFYLQNRAGLSQNLILAPTVFLLQIVNLLLEIFNHIHNFEDNNTLIASTQSTKPANTSSLNEKLEFATNWGFIPIFHFTVFKIESFFFPKVSATKFLRTNCRYYNLLKHDLGQSSVVYYCC